MSTRSVSHPFWCQYPQSPGDHTHAHTAAVGQALLLGGVVADVVLVQPLGDDLVLRMHLDGPGVRVAVDLTGVQAWSLAGVLIDATVSHRQAAIEPAASSAAPPAGVESPPPAAVPGVRRVELAEPVRSWLTRHRVARSPRRVRRAFRCPRPAPPPPAEPGDEQPEIGPWW
jgi:hypothetical protein